MPFLSASRTTLELLLNIFTHGREAPCGRSMRAGAPHGQIRSMTDSIETASLIDDADIEPWWSQDADITGRLVAAIAMACAAVPSFNARFDVAAGRFEPLPTVDLGIVIETEAGVAVPVLADIGHASVTEIRRRLNALRTRVEAGASRPPVTLVNFGRGPCRYASLPVVPPQVAIVAAGQVLLQPARLEGRIVERHVLPLTLTYDTRASGLTGAARFLGAIKTDLAKRDLPLTRGWR
jgi:2-oxoisovalerate dehydrogenase E2 component (dihydrolipoyl transacylase)